MKYHQVYNKEMQFVRQYLRQYEDISSETADTNCGPLEQNVVLFVENLCAYSGTNWDYFCQWQKYIMSLKKRIYKFTIVWSGES